MKLDDVQKNIANMARQQDEARKLVRDQEQEKETNGAAQAPPAVDDLTEIVGIGKVFQHTLHKLGYYTFQQIANFGPADIARVNLALKENKGRMEQDDWIGQAKELYFKRHSEMVEH
jgi:predicted flap endonuclease-1-like 5' DNA nuclease